MSNHICFAGSPLRASRMRFEARKTCDPSVGSIVQNGPFRAAQEAFSERSHTVKVVLIGDRHT